MGEGGRRSHLAHWKKGTLFNFVGRTTYDRLTRSYLRKYPGPIKKLTFFQYAWSGALLLIYYSVSDEEFMLIPNLFLKYLIQLNYGMKVQEHNFCFALQQLFETIEIVCNLF